MASTGFILAGAGANVTGVGTEAWANPGNITADDGTNASGEAADKNEQMNYLQGSSFGFSIPTGATINGIELRFQASDSSATAYISHAVIGKSDSTLGSDLETGSTFLSPTPTNYTYGSSTELWGLSWTSAEINNSTFQGRMSANAFFDMSIGNPVVDAMWINVHYTPHVDYPLTAGTGSLNLTGQNAGLSVQRKLTAGTGLFALTGQVAALVRGRKVSPAPGAFALTGIAARLAHTGCISSAAGAYTLAGNAAILAEQHRLAAALGAFTLTGLDAVLTKSAPPNTLISNAGDFVFTGIPAALRAQRIFSAQKASLTLTGNGIRIVRARYAVCAPGTLTLSGLPAVLHLNRNVVIAPAAFTLSGLPVTFIRVMPFSRGTFVLAGLPAGLSAGRRTSAAKGTFTLTGNAAAFRSTRKLRMGTAQLVLTGVPVLLKWSGATPPSFFDPLKKPANPLIANPKTGVLNKEWELHFKALVERVNALNPKLLDR